VIILEQGWSILRKTRYNASFPAIYSVWCIVVTCFFCAFRLCNLYMKPFLIQQCSMSRSYGVVPNAIIPIAPRAVTTDEDTFISHNACCTCTTTRERRRLSDFQITSHIPFGFVFLLSIYKHFYEMTILVGLVLVFSLLYHFGAEERTVFSYIDNCTAFSLSMYGNVQLFYSPSSLVLGINLSLGLSAALIFVLGYTHTFAPYYNVLHPIGLHIIPAIWSTIVVLFQKPFIF